MIQHRVHGLELLSGEDLVNQMRRTLLSLVTEHSASSAVAARHLGLSTRTLARRLAAEGTTFAKLRDEARYAMAQQLLGFTTMPCSEVACRIGRAPRWCRKDPPATRAERTAVMSQLNSRLSRDRDRAFPLMQA